MLEKASSFLIDSSSTNREEMDRSRYTVAKLLSSSIAWVSVRLSNFIRLNVSERKENSGEEND